MTSISELKEIMIQYTKPLVRLAYYYVKDLQVAEDIVQEVFIGFHENRDSYAERGQLKAYLRRLTINKCKDYLKSWSYRKIQLHNKLFHHKTVNNRDRLVKNDEQAIVGDAILRLPIKQREVLIYFYFDEMSISEVAQTLSIPEGTVKSRLRRGKDLLKKQLEGLEWEVLLNE